MALDKHIQWGVADFERYHSGKMSESERHALEKAALDDPFLEDALDGYAFTQTAVTDIKAIKEQLWPAEDDIKTPVVWFKQKAISQLFKAAAVLIVFAGLGWLVFNNYKQDTPTNKGKGVASIEQTVPKEKETTPVFDLNKDSIPAVAMLEDQPSKKGITNLSTESSPAATWQSVDDSISLPAEADDLARNEARAKDKADFVIKPAPSKISPQLEGKVPGINAKTSTANEVAKKAARNQGLLSQNQVRGRVVDQDGQPVPFATVRNNADARQVINADAQGNFALQNNVATNSNLPVEINAVGYDSKQTNLTNNSSNTIVLNQKEEVGVADGYSAKARKEKYQWTGKNSLIQLKNATPLEGWDYFYYVMNDSIVNNHYFNVSKGRITLQFEADTNGNVKNIVVKKSMNDSADNAAMRILLKSPVLQINDRKKKAEATIKFNY